MKKRKISEGFTLLELLATIIIISLIFSVSGYLVMNTINNAKDKSTAIAENNIKKSASIYTEEYSDDVIWSSGEDNTKYACVSVSSLIDKGYFKKEDVDDSTLSKYIIVTKNESNAIISTEYDVPNENGKTKCEKTISTNKVTIPIAKKYCNTLTYTGDSQTLVKSPDTGFTFTTTTTGTNAGSYKITAELNANYVWKDDTTEDKTITCTIKKATPNFYGGKTGEDGKDLQNDTVVVLKSDVSGTLTIKTSNKEVATASLSNKTISANGEVALTIKKLSTRKSATYITVTLTPKDNSNYKKTSFVYTINNVTKKKIKTTPTSSVLCKEIYYDGNSHTLIDTSKIGEGYTLYNTDAREIGKHDVIARLKYGYAWSDGTTQDKTITCEIKTPTPTVTYNNNGGSGCGSKTVTYNSTYGDLCTPSRTGYTFNGWYTVASGGTKIERTTKVTNFNNHTIYAHWTVNYYALDINPVINGTIQYSGLSGFTFSVKVNGNTLASNVIDFYQSIQYGAKVEIVPNAVIGYSNYNTYTFTMPANNYSVSTPTWRVNVCTITYDKNGGEFDSNSNSTIQKLEYGDITGDMRNASGGYYIATKKGYEINKAKAWIRTSPSQKTFNQGNSYKAEEICPNLGSGDESVTLKVNWYKTKYKKQTCTQYKSCSSSDCGCSSYNQSCSTTYSCPSGAHWQSGRCCRPTNSSSGICETVSSVPHTSCWNTSCKSYYSCRTSACGCKTWSGASIVTSCSADGSTKCSDGFKCYKTTKTDDDGKAC